MRATSKIFDSKGPIAKALHRYERREVQIQMADAIETVIEKGGVLLAEAGTGTGKTLAYLIPAILSDCQIVISTGTKNLQEQIFFKDIKFLERALNETIDAVYLKGQNNYLCLRRLREFLNSKRVLDHSPSQITELEAWSNRTSTGDRMELEGLKDDDAMWREVCSTKDTRIGNKCHFSNECFVTSARLKAMQAKLIVVNHHLYFADLSTRLKGGAILPSHDVVIFDEAHAIEDVATEFFSISVSSSRIKRILSDAIAAIRIAKLNDDPAEERRPKLLETAESASNTLFACFRMPELGRERLIPEEIDSRHVAAYHRLDAALDAVEQSLAQLEGRDENVDHSVKRINELRDDLQKIVGKTVKGFVHWVENRKRSVILGASPIDVSEMLRDGIFFTIPTVILTSATLSTGGDFSFLRSRVGLDFEVSELSLPSPFNYEKQVSVYLPTHIVDPRDKDFSQQAAMEAEKLIHLSKGGALFLFTSLRNMRAIHSLLKGRLRGPVLLQGDAPRSILLARFQEDPYSVLFATASFWQGVDIPGDALRLVIIDKLPFASPKDPLTQARIEYLAASGRNSFIEYQVPGAALSLKQGFGRLIRTQYDRGIVAILDKRLQTMSYARVFLSSLPQCPKLSNFEDAENWWHSTIHNPNKHNPT